MKDIKSYVKKIKFKKITLVSFLMAVIIFTFGFFMGKNQPFSPEKEQDQKKEIRQGGYQFINPLLDCEVYDDQLFKPLEARIKGRVQSEAIGKNPNTQVSLYFRNLNNGPSFGINENEDFSPASLLKVPLMIAYYKLSEKDPSILNKKIVFMSPSVQYKQKLQEEHKFTPGKEYSVNELIENMIVYSDNDSLILLFQSIDPNDLKIIYSDLGITMPDIYDPNNQMTVKNYASFFRILYNASYLNKENSEKALDLLSRVEFKEGVSKGVDSAIKIAHKFGERESLNKQGKVIRQLHDCGIVYYVPYPYLICVMTRGDDFKDLSSIIGNVSKIVFEEVRNNYK